MGWRCPVCNEDFGLNKMDQEEHMATEHNGCAQDIEKALKNLAEGDDENESA